MSFLSSSIIILLYLNNSGLTIERTRGFSEFFSWRIKRQHPTFSVAVRLSPACILIQVQ